MQRRAAAPRAPAGVASNSRIWLDLLQIIGFIVGQTYQARFLSNCRRASMRSSQELFVHRNILMECSASIGDRLEKDARRHHSRPESVHLRAGSAATWHQTRKNRTLTAVAWRRLLCRSLLDEVAV